jgi:predicted exporter
MPPAFRRKFWCRAVLVLLGAGSVAWLARMDYRQKISTDILDLIPAGRGNPELALVRNLAGDVQAKVVLFALRDARAPGAPPGDAARAFAASLRESPAWAEVVTLDDDRGQEKLGAALFAARDRLRLPSWLGQEQLAFSATGLPPEKFSPWAAERAAADLEDFLRRPEAIPSQDLLPADPLLLIPRLIGQAEALGSPAAQAGGCALVWARMRASPLADEGQRPVFATIERAQASLAARWPAVAVSWTGVNRFAAASRARIEAEVKVLNLLSLAAVLAVAIVFVRRPWKLLHLAPVVAGSLLGAWTVATVFTPRLHILVFAIGSLLIGVAIDYGFYIYMQPSLDPGEDYGRKLRRLLRPLLASCLTTVIGFSLLLWSELPLIRQVGLFVSAGLLCALGTAMLYFGQLDQPTLESRPWARRRPGPPGAARRWRGGLALAAAAVAIAGAGRLHWRDDVRELQIPNPALEANDEGVRRLFGDTPDRSLYLTYGATLPEARERLEAFSRYLASSGPAGGSVSLGLVFPTEEDWRQMPGRLARLRDFASDFRAALVRHGFVPEAFRPFFKDWAELQRHPPAGDYPALYALGQGFSGPTSQLYHTDAALSWFLTVAPRSDLRPPDRLQTIGVDQLQSLDDLFRQYRYSALRLSLIGLALVIASVFVIYPWSAARRIALIPAGSCLAVFGAFGLLGHPLNLFHLLGAFLGVCLSHNYAIFSSASARQGQPPPVPVRLSALCAAAAFGVLGFSHIPVVHALGATVALIVLTAWVAIELESLARSS